ncbi:nitrite reductase [Rummeliibacillus sp. TYF005]|uniref:nitrite reductase n=1 Tax=unclassified Rummeliibacillus TaxID=2622809 RepID=UPI000E66811F|nr:MULTISPECIES: nitrite reductase [unclassified Rummeliibacillus]RIJ66216.1 nitrite reductase [Rummeliibacillus sp. POC4]RPJ95216.1 nitrite reductase [Rummeliibacillus sp. TYF005]
MGKIFRGIVLAIIGILGVILSLLSSTDLISSPNSNLNSKKIDKNIKKLRELRWFNDLYIDERHHKSFFINVRVRKYLQSNILVSRLKNNKKEQQKFIQLLEYVAKKRD